MAFQDHYSEVLDVTSDMFCHIFDNIKAQLGPELEAIRKQARALAITPQRPLSAADILPSEAYVQPSLAPKQLLPI